MQLEYSKYNIKIKVENNTQFVFDIIRKKYLVLTPEEYVRQHIIHYLVYDHQFPKSLISIEKKHVLNELTRRTDIVLYNKTGHAVMLVECKSPSIKINQAVLNQAGRYNITLKVNYIAVTNGLVTLCCKINHQKNNFKFLPSLPGAQELLQES